MFKSPNSFYARSRIAERINSFFWWIVQYPPPVGKTEKEVSQNRIQQSGSAAELFVTYLLENIYSPEDLEADREKAYWQVLNGRDGVPDEYDIRLKGYGNIDVKLDRSISKGTVCLEVKTAGGKDSLLLNTNVNYSVHVVFEGLPLPKSVKRRHRAKLVAVNLDKVREYVKSTEHGYCLSEYCSDVNYRYGTELLYVPIEYLKQKGIAEAFSFH